MGSGKSTVGSRLARRLGWDHVDLDEVIESRTGSSVEEIFRDRGEQRFRELEAEVGREVLAGRDRVVSTGGGWAAAPERMESLDPGVLSVWLQVSPETAVERAKRGSVVRPLLEVANPVARARELLRARTAFYRKAELHLDTESRSPEDLASVIVEHMGRA